MLSLWYFNLLFNRLCIDMEFDYSDREVIIVTASYVYWLLFSEYYMYIYSFQWFNDSLRWRNWYYIYNFFFFWYLSNILTLIRGGSPHKENVTHTNIRPNRHINQYTMWQGGMKYVIYILLQKMGLLIGNLQREMSTFKIQNESICGNLQLYLLVYHGHPPHIYKM